VVLHLTSLRMWVSVVAPHKFENVGECSCDNIFEKLSGQFFSLIVMSH
jgi:hypothetical protein